MGSAEGDEAVAFAQEETHRSEAMLRAICEATTEGVVLHDEGRLLSYNDAAAAMMRVPPEAGIGRNVLEFVAPVSREVVRQRIATGVTSPYTAWVERPDGSRFRAEIRVRLVRYGDGQARAAVIRDLTEADEVERARAESISLLRATIDSTADGILVVDLQGRVVLYNERFRQLWSIPPTAEIKMEDATLAFVEAQLVDGNGFRVRLEALHGRPDLESTDRLEFRDGRILERYSRPQRVGKHVVGRVFSFRDVTARVRAERALEIAVQVRDEFLGIASHELFTPLTSLTVAMRGLRTAQTLNDPTTSERLLASAERQVTRLTRLVQELLDVTRIDGGRLALNVEPVDLCEVARDTLERFAPELERAGIRAELEVRTPVSGLWDRIRLEQVLTNLLSNAIKFGQGQPIAVSVHPYPGGAALAVRDQGIGIPHDRQAQIFERFQRAVSSRHYAGLGLGLFITRQIVEAHGGYLRLESTPGKGSTFTVELPLVSRVEAEVG